MEAAKLNRELYALGVPPDKTNLFENAIFAVNNGEPNKVIGHDDDGDEVIAYQLLDAFGLDATDY